jgi:hypothetical protein
MNCAQLADFGQSERCDETPVRNSPDANPEKENVMDTRLKKIDDLKELAEAELEHVHGGAAPDQGSGKNPSGNKVDVFAGNPHDRPGANAKD